MKNKLISFLLTIALIITLIPTNIFATNTESNKPLTFEENIAEGLKELNLFKGSANNDLALDKPLSRIEALIIMLRLMGKEAEILAGEYQHPFTDVPTWADKYVGYAYENKLTNGISATKFGVDNIINKDFIIFILRALNYKDNIDFIYNDPYTLATKLGIINCLINLDDEFIRADCAIIIFYALDITIKDSNITLAEYLIANKVFKQETYIKIKNKILDYADLSKAFAIDNIKWNRYPKTLNEYLDNFIYAFIRGYWDYDTSETFEDYEWEYKFSDIGCIRADLLGWFTNLNFCSIGYKNNKFYIFTNGVKPVYSVKEITTMIYDTYSKAKEIYTSMHNSKSIKENTTPTELIAVYSDYLNNLNIIPGKTNITNNLTLEAKRNYMMQEMIYDSGYSCLYKKISNCVGRVAIFNLLMHLEGLECFGLPVKGHVISCVNINNQFIVLDWYQADNINLYSFNDFLNGITPWQTRWDKSNNNLYNYMLNRSLVN